MLEHPAELSDRDFLEAVLYLNRVGCPWRDLPAEFGYWHAVYMDFGAWEERGVWRRLWQHLQCESFAQARDLLMDSTTVRAHQHAAGAPKKTAATRLWATLRGGLSTKIHAATIDENCSVSLLQARNPIPQGPKIYFVERQPSNIPVKINGML